MNAIILAAGTGSRLYPYTEHLPKCLIKINNTPIIEQQIIYLQEKGIIDITIVSGYKSDSLNYLSIKYNLDIVFNKDYHKYNNIYSLYLVRNKFMNTYIIEGDIWMQQNCFQTNLKHSSYLAKWKNNYKDEWGLVVDNELNLKSITIGQGSGYLMSGISYWTKRDSYIIIKALQLKIENGNFKDLYWDNAVLETIKELNIKIIPTNEIYEIDTIEDLCEIDISYKIYN